MEKLFGLPINQVMVSLLVVFAVGTLLTAFAAWRNPVLFKMGARNIPRRRAQTVLIVLGLMLATVLFSASFATGDTLAYSIRVEGLKRIGQIDETITSEARDSAGRTARFDQALLDTVKQALAGNPDVDGVAPALREVAPVLSQTTSLSDPQVQILGFDESEMGAFDKLTAEDGRTLPLSALGPDEVYISVESATKMDVQAGAPLQVFFGEQPTTLTVAGVYVSGANPAGEHSMVMPLDRLQTLTGFAGKISSVLISNTGDAISGSERTDAVAETLAPALEGTGLELNKVKQEALAQADDAGAQFASIFLLFGQFSIMAGILLIFLIFIMLAAERKQELGIARAVGMQAKHVIRMFVFEGALYALLAAAVGSILGLAVGWAMVRIIVIAFADFDFNLTYSFNWRSLVIAYTMGMAVTFAVVLLASWRVSKLNVVAAIRDIPETKRHRQSVFVLLLLIGIPMFGVLLAAGGLSLKSGALWSVGTSLVIIGLPLLARRVLHLPERLAYTLAGLGLVVWWNLPFDTFEGILPDLNQGIEMFFLSGIMLVLGGVWTVMYNSDLILKAIVFVFGGIKGAPPVLKTAISYPMQNRFRTGMTLAMFSLVVFTLIVMAFIISAFNTLFEDTERISGGWHIAAHTSYTNPVRNFSIAALEDRGVDTANVAAIGSLANAPMNAKAEGSAKDADLYFFSAVDQGYADTTTYKFALRADGLADDRAVWNALMTQPNTVIINTININARSNFNVGGPTASFKFENVYLEDGVLPEIYLVVTNTVTNTTQRLRVVGVFGDDVFSPSLISQATLANLAGVPVPPTSYLVRLKDTSTAQDSARSLERAFLQNGLQATIIKDEIEKESSASIMLNNLLQGFMGLGLVVGIAALGVIAARSVVERRQQIGVMRALGFQRAMVQASFLLESSYIALLGIGIGLVLGMTLSVQIVSSIAENIDGIRYVIPVGNLLLVVAIGYGASLLTTFLPARQASRVYPAEAIRAD